MSTRDAFLADIRAFLAKHDMAADVFGKLAMNDVAFVYRLRERDIRASTIDKVRAFMAAYDKKKRRAGEARMTA